MSISLAGNSSNFALCGRILEALHGVATIDTHSQLFTVGFFPCSLGGKGPEGLPPCRHPKAPHKTAGQLGGEGKEDWCVCVCLVCVCVSGGSMIYVNQEVGELL